MAFEIGERVTNHFTGPGTIKGPLVKEDDGTAMQFIEFDHPLMRARLYPISRLQVLEPEPEPKPRRHLLDNDDPAAIIRAYTSPLFTSDLLLSWNKVKKVRVISPQHRQEQTRQLLDSLGILYPAEYRGTIAGKRGGKTVQRSLSAQIHWLDGSKPINDRNLVLKILSEGRLGGWHVTELV